MAISKSAQRLHVRRKIRARPACDELRIRTDGRKGAPGGKVGGLHTKEHGNQDWVNLRVGATQQKIRVPPAGRMRRDIKIHVKASGMGFKPFQLLIERPKTADESLVAVPWGFGEEDRL